MDRTYPVAFMTHRGAVRAENQDAVFAGGVVRIGDMDQPELLEQKAMGPKVLEPNGLSRPLLLAVIDGMGGPKGGGLAARIIAETLAEESNGAFGPQFDPKEDELILRRMLEKAESKMREEARKNPELAGMGATMAGVLLRETRALAFNCGDCRVYRLSGGEMERVTRDHSIVGALFEKGVIDEEQMREHPQKNIVTSAVSADERERFELYVKGLSRCEGDSFFLCSDGVWEALSSQELAQWLAQPFPSAARELFDALIAAECSDNVSFVWQA